MKETLSHEIRMSFQNKDRIYHMAACIEVEHPADASNNLLDDK